MLIIQVSQHEYIEIRISYLIYDICYKIKINATRYTKERNRNAKLARTCSSAEEQT